MQIIIVQTEIEQAIRNHILSQINIKDGMRIDIDLSATRGADGFKATIDIVPDTAPAKTVTAEAAPAPAAAAPKARTLSISKPTAAVAVPKGAAKTEPVAAAAPTETAVTEAAPAAGAQEDPAEDPPFDVTPAGDAPAAEAAEQVETKAAETVAEVPAAAPVTTGKSLFANLRKPS